jgi:hypothetical protein
MTHSERLTVLSPVSESETEIRVDAVDSLRKVRLVRAVMWVVTITAGLLQALAARFYVTGDGNSYLDVATAYLQKGFANAINGYWSPFYSWLIAFVFWIFKPSRYWESTILHLLVFAGLLVALRAFEFFFSTFLSAKQNFIEPQGASVQVPAFVWWVLGYGLFLSTSLEVLTMAHTSADVWVCAVTFLCSGLILKIWMNGGGLPYFAVLGLSLGFGYFAKAFYFPLGFVFIGTCWLAGRGPRKNITGAVVAFVAFLLVASPFVIALSRAKHRLTFGDSGKIAYAYFMDQVDQPMFFWRGGDGSGTPKHAARIILASPTVYEFAEPIGGSFPPWYDPSYWMDGITAHFRLINELRIVRQSVGTFFLVLLTQLEYVVALAALIFCNLRGREWLAVIWRQWFVWLPAAAGCLGFASVLLEGRYIASFLVILWLAAFAASLSCASVATQRVAVAIIFAAVFVTGVKTIKYATSDALAIPKAADQNWAAAQKLREFAGHPGDRVALIGLFAEQHFLRLAEVRAVAELSYGDEQRFWTGDTALQSSVFKAFASTGARVVVAVHAPITAVKDGWTRLGNTDYYARLLPAKP